MQTPCQKCGKQVEVTVTSIGSVFRCAECKMLSALLRRDPDGRVVFGDYEVLREVGQGSNAIVCKGRQVSTGEIRALKLFVADALSEAHAFREFSRESQLATQIVHPNIVRVHEAGALEGVPYVVMEYVPGLNMAQLLDEYGPLDQFDAVNIGCRICDALDYVWNNFLMIHRDIKPQNLILDKEGQVKVCDFGMIVDHSASVVDLNAVEGTPYYLSPESISEGTYLDNRTDIYSLGASLYHMIGGRPPFDYGNLADVVQARLREPPPDLRDVAPTTHPEIAMIVKAMMGQTPDDRYNTASECRDDLERVKAGQPALLPSRHGAANP